MGSPCLFTRQQAFKMGYFYWLRVKNSNYLHGEFSLGYLGDANFYFESKTSFIDISSIAWQPSFILWATLQLIEKTTQETMGTARFHNSSLRTAFMCSSLHLMLVTGESRANSYQVLHALLLCCYKAEHNTRSDRVLDLSYFLGYI